MRKTARNIIFKLTTRMGSKQLEKGCEFPSSYMQNLCNIGVLDSIFENKNE
ncbi:hypothetical protein Hanom_Chr09g00794891 [Helianthus anomalus]